MTNQEKELFNAVPATEFNTYWIPCTWFIYRIQEAAKNKKLINDYALETIIRVGAQFILSLFVPKLPSFVPKRIQTNSTMYQNSNVYFYSGVQRISCQVRTALVLRLGVHTHGVHAGTVKVL